MSTKIRGVYICPAGKNKPAPYKQHTGVLLRERSEKLYKGGVFYICS